MYYYSITVIVICIVFLFFITSILGSNCPNGIAKRREHRDLSQKEWDDFVHAIYELNKKPSKIYPELSKLEEYAKIHVDQFKVIHTYNDPKAKGTPAPINTIFLAWHRNFIRDFEMELQKINPNVSLPYWDQSIDFNAPEKSSIFNSNRMGGSAPLNNGEASDCIPNGPFVNLKHKKYGCIKRGFTVDGHIAQDMIANAMPFQVIDKSIKDQPKVHLPSGALVQGVIDNTPNWVKFSEAVEFVIHPCAHIFVGGNRHGTMNKGWSPQDPLFFLHHSYTDYIWARWQSTNKGSFDYTDKPLPGYEHIKAGQVSNIADLCYEYVPANGLKIQPQSNSKSKSQAQSQSESLSQSQSQPHTVLPTATSSLASLSKRNPIQHSSVTPVPTNTYTDLFFKTWRWNDTYSLPPIGTRTASDTYTNQQLAPTVDSVMDYTHPPVPTQSISQQYQFDVLPGYPQPPEDYPGFLLRPLPSKDRRMPILSDNMLLGMGYDKNKVQKTVQYVVKIERKIEAKVARGEYVPAFSETKEVRKILSKHMPSLGIVITSKKPNRKRKKCKRRKSHKRKQCPAPTKKYVWSNHQADLYSYGSSIPNQELNSLKNVNRIILHNTETASKSLKQTKKPVSTDSKIDSNTIPRVNNSLYGTSSKPISNASEKMSIPFIVGALSIVFIFFLFI